MFIRKKKSPNTPNKTSIQIVENVRKGNKVSQSVIRHVGIALNDDEVKDLIMLAEKIKFNLEQERQPVLPLFDPEDILKERTKAREAKKREDKPINVNLKELKEEQRINEGIVDVFGTLYDEISFDKIFTGKNSKSRNATLKSCVMARLANPSSKTRSTELVENDFAIKLPIDRIFRMMDQLEKIGDKVKSFVRDATLGILGEKVNVLLYDVTTLYFESFTEDELREFGFSKDCKFKEVQVVMVLIATTKGLPITYELFPGSTTEVKTLLPVITNMKEKYNVSDVEFVADRGLFSGGNLDILEDEGIEYVVAAKLKNMSKKVKDDILTVKPTDLDTFNSKEIEYKGRRLIVNYSPKRAAKDKKDRERLLERLEKITDKTGKVEVKNLVRNSGTKKYLKFNKENKSIAEINKFKIGLEERWDGIHGVVTNSKKITINEAFEKYSNLWLIEESFRINKHDLKLRPIFHRTKERIEAHLLICFLAYALARQMMYRVELQYEKMSFAKIRDQLLSVQASVLVNHKNKKKYLIPSKASLEAVKLYRTLGLNRSTVPSEITN